MGFVDNNKNTECCPPYPLSVQDEGKMRILFLMRLKSQNVIVVLLFGIVLSETWTDGQMKLPVDGQKRQQLSERPAPDCGMKL